MRLLRPEFDEATLAVRDGRIPGSEEIKPIVDEALSSWTTRDEACEPRDDGRD